LATRPELETARLSLRRLEFADAPQLVELLNQPSFLANIGDRGVRNVDDACRYLREGPMAMYEQYGFGLWRVGRRTDDRFVGMCGLLKRDTLPAVDVGYAFLPEHWGQGYAFEAASATIELGVRKFGLERIIAVVSAHNAASIRVLEKAGMRFERMHPMHPGEPEVRLYSREFRRAELVG
jgi:RimJ/RimL family protein N-acetyltransferase